MEKSPLTTDTVENSWPGKQRDPLALGCLMLVLLAVYLPLHVFFPPSLGYEYDSADYLAGAKSLAAGQGFRMCYWDGTPPITFCPPLNSTYFSLVFRLFPDFPANLRWLNLAMVLIIVGSTVLFYLILCRFQITPFASACIAGGIVLSPFWYQTAAIFYSDILFSVIAGALILLWIGNWPASRNRKWLVTGIGMAAMYLTRTATLAPLVAVLVVLMFDAVQKRNLRPLLCFLGPVVLAVGLWNANKIGDHRDSYQTAIHAAIHGLGGWSGYVQATLAQGYEYFFKLHFLDTVFPILVRLPGIPTVQNLGLAPLFSGLAYVVEWSLIGLMAWGMIRAKAVVHRALAFVLCAYLAQLVAYPFWVGERGLFPALPLMLGFAWQGWRDFSLPERFRKPLAIMGTLFLVVSLAGSVRLVQTSRNLLEKKSQTRAAEELAIWISDHIAPTDKLAAGGDVPVLLLSILTHRTFADEFAALRPAHSLRVLRSDERFRYVLISTNTAPMITALRASYFKNYKILKRSSEGNLILFEVPVEP